MLPTSVKIGACYWSVLLTDVPEDEMGHCDFLNHAIHIDKNLAPGAQEETFVHELLHACCYAAGFQDSQGLTEEDFVGRVSYTLHGALRENDFWPKS